MRPRQIAFQDLTAEDVAQWTTLAATALEPNPFFDPAFVLPAVRHLGEGGLSLLVVEDDERAWRACLPIQRTRVAHLMPGVRTWRHMYCFLGTPLLDPAVPRAAARSLLGAAVSPGRRLALECLVDGGQASDAIRAAADELGLCATPEHAHERAMLRRRANGGYLADMRSHRRRELNRLGRRLEVEVGAPVTVSDRRDLHVAVERFLELERSGWKGRGQTALASSERHADFFRDVCAAFGADGRLELLALSAGNRTVAMKCNLYAGEGGFCFKIAYDESLGRFSPGVQLERANISAFHQNRHEAWQDSCADPENDMINRLWPDRRRIYTAVLTRRGARSAVSRQGIRAARAIRDMERRRSSARS